MPSGPSHQMGQNVPRWRKGCPVHCGTYNSITGPPTRQQSWQSPCHQPGVPGMESRPAGWFVSVVIGPVLRVTLSFQSRQSCCPGLLVPTDSASFIQHVISSFTATCKATSSSWDQVPLPFAPIMCMVPSGSACPGSASRSLGMSAAPLSPQLFWGDLHSKQRLSPRGWRVTPR